MEHLFHVVMRRDLKTPVEQALLAAIMLLSVDQYSSLTPEEIFDRLIHDFKDAYGNCAEPGQPFLSMLYRRMLRMEHTMLNHFNTLEHTQLTTSTAVSRLQTTADNLAKQVTTMQTAADTAASDQAESNAALLKDIADLRAAIGSGDEAALTAVADSLDSTASGFADVQTKLESFAKAEVDSEAAGNSPPPPPPPLSITITGPDSVAAGNTGSFSANVPVTWTANIGTIDGNGVYTPPPDATVTADTITATAADGTVATKSITLTQ